MKIKTYLSALLLAALLVSSCFPLAARAADFDLTLPEGLLMPSACMTEKECAIICCGQRIGGVILTDLNPMALAMDSKDKVLNYLVQYVPETLFYEYMMDWGPGDVMTVDWIMIDPEVMRSREFRHYLYEKDGSVYDLWLDHRYVDGEMENAIVTENGILDLTVFNPEEEPDFNFNLPENFTLGTPSGNACPILYGGAEVGGIALTRLNELALQSDDGRLNINDYLPEAEVRFGEFSTAQFALSRYLSRNLPETSGYEYMIYYGTDRDELPTADVMWKVTDGETGDVTEYLHTFFVKNCMVYDLWLNYSLLDKDRVYGLPEAIGIR